MFKNFAKTTTGLNKTINVINSDNNLKGFKKRKNHQPCQRNYSRRKSDRQRPHESKPKRPLNSTNSSSNLTLGNRRPRSFNRSCQRNLRLRVPRRQSNKGKIPKNPVHPICDFHLHSCRLFPLLFSGKPESDSISIAWSSRESMASKLKAFCT